MLLLRILLFALGLCIVGGTLRSAIRTFVLPRAANDGLTRRWFFVLGVLLLPLTRASRDPARREASLGLYAPIGLLMLPIIWLTFVLAGYMAMFIGLGGRNAREAFMVSGSSLLTLGFAALNDLPSSLLGFTEAAIGLILVALLISYLPTMYSAFSKRETTVTLLEVRAGTPPSAVEMLLRHHRLGRMDEIDTLWTLWEVWFAEVQETHTSLAALAFFRSPQPDHSWITAAGAVLDAAAFRAAVLDLPRDLRAELLLRAGFIALRRIVDFFGVPYDTNPPPDAPILITRAEWDAACDRLMDAGVPMKEDREQAWRDWAGWRVNYDFVLITLAQIIKAPYAPWSSDRSILPRRKQRAAGSR